MKNSSVGGVNLGANGISINNTTLNGINSSGSNTGRGLSK